MVEPEGYSQAEDAAFTAHVGPKGSAPVPGEEIPPDSEWFTKRLIRAREAVIACAACRSAVSRGMEDIATQLDEGTTALGSPSIQASGAIVPRLPPGMIIEIIRMVGYNGGNKLIPLFVGPETILLTELELGATVEQIANQPSAVAMRALAQKIRQQASSCCRAQVYKRLLPQSSKRKWIKVKSHRVRLPKGLFGL